MSRKKQEAEELLAPDPFMEKATSGMNWLEKNVKIVVGVGLLGLAAVVGAQFVMSEGTREESAVTMDLTAAIEEFGEATSLQTVLTSTSPESLNKKYSSARKGFTDFRSANPKHPAAAIAAVYEGELARRLGDFAQAQKLFDTYVDATKADAPLRFMALEGAGYAYESDGKLDEALARFTTLASEQPFFADYALKHKARILEKKGDTAGAIAAYEELAALDDPRQEAKEGATIDKTPLKAFAEDRLKSLK